MPKSVEQAGKGSCGSSVAAAQVSTTKQGSRLLFWLGEVAPTSVASMNFFFNRIL